jgi:hypothetical protein
MNFRTTALLFGLVLGMFALFGLMLAIKRTPLDETFVLPTLRADYDNIDWNSVEVVRSVKGKDEVWTFTRNKDDKWLLSVKGEKGVVDNIRLKLGRTGDDIIRNIKDAQKDEDAELRQNFSEYGLDKPEYTVVMKGKEKKKIKIGKDKEQKEEKDDSPRKEREWKLLVGEQRGGLAYVSGAEGDAEPRKVVAVKRGALARVFDKINAVRSDVLLDYNDNNLTTVRIEGKQEVKGDVELKKVAENTWEFVKPGGYGLADWEGPPAPKPNPHTPFPPPVDKKDAGVKALLAAIRDIRVQSEDDFVDLTAKPADYGLQGGKDGKESFLIQVQEGTKAPEYLIIGKKETKKEGKEDVSVYYVKMKNDPGIAKIAARTLDPIIAALKNPDELRNRDLLTFNTDKVDALKITLKKPEKTDEKSAKKDEKSAKKDDKPDNKEIVNLRLSDNWYASSSVDSKWRKANKEMIVALLKHLNGKREIKDFKDPVDKKDKDELVKLDKSLGLEKPPVVIDLWVGGIEKEEKKKDDKDKKDDKKVDKKEAKDKKAEAKKPEPKKDPDPKIKKDAESTAILYFGEPQDDFVWVKREAYVLLPDEPENKKDKDKKDKKDPDKIVTRVKIPKSFFDKLLPKQPKNAELRAAITDPALAYLDPSMPPLVAADKPPRDVERVEIAENKKTKVSVERTKFGKPFEWILAGKDEKDLAGRNGADSGEVMGLINEVTNLRAERWLRKYDDKAAEDMGLSVPAVTVTIATKELLSPVELARLVSQQAVRRGAASAWVEAMLTVAAVRGKEKEEPTVIKFGKEVKDDDKTYVYAYHSGNGMVFLTSPDIVKQLREADVRDKSGIANSQGQLDAALVAALASPNRVDAFLGVSPLFSQRLAIFDPAKVKDIKLVIRSRFELREFNFQKTGDKTWKDVSPGLKEFNVNSEGVTKFLDEVADRKAESRLVGRFLQLDTKPQAYHKFDAKDAVVKLEVTTDDGKKVTLTIGAPFNIPGFKGHFAHVTTSNWPGMVFLTSARWVGDLLQDPLSYFGKERVAAAP